MSPRHTGSESQPDRTHLASTVASVMERDLVVVSENTPLPDVERVLEGRAVSCAIVRAHGRPVGVVSRTDLLRAARREALLSGGRVAPIPAFTVGSLCKRPPITVDEGASVSAAARRMVDERVHRVFAVRGDEIVGVVSTHDVLHAIVGARVPASVDRFMSTPVLTVPYNASLAHATDRLSHENVSGLIVVDAEGHPIGHFSQREALLARRLHATEPVEDAMDPTVAKIAGGSPLHHAAELARATKARRVLVMDRERPAGVLSPLDFMRAVSG